MDKVQLNSCTCIMKIYGYVSSDTKYGFLLGSIASFGFLGKSDNLCPYVLSYHSEISSQSFVVCHLRLCGKEIRCSRRYMATFK
jgi:hypothetical protein